MKSARNILQDETFFYDPVESVDKYCFRCHCKLCEETELDYPYYCPECDENMYDFETLNYKEV